MLIIILGLGVYNANNYKSSFNIIANLSLQCKELHSHLLINGLGQHNKCAVAKTCSTLYQTMWT